MNIDKRNKFGAPSYGSPQAAILAEMSESTIHWPKGEMRRPKKGTKSAPTKGRQRPRRKAAGYSPM